MSQVNTTQDVFQIEIQSIQNQINSALGNALTVSSVTELNGSVTNLFPGINQQFSINAQSVSLKKGKLISSPQSLRSGFNKALLSEVKQIEKGGMSGLQAHKTGFISTLSKMDIKMTDIKAIESQLKKVANAGTVEEVKTAVLGVMNTLEVQHQQVFTQNIGVALQQSMVSTGLSQTKFMEMPGGIRVVGMNEQGKVLISEVSIDSKTQRVDIVSETIGFEGDKCKETMSTFLLEAEKRGLKSATGNNTKQTKVPVGSYAEQLDMVLKKTKKQDKKKPKLPPPPSLLKH